MFGNKTHFNVGTFILIVKIGENEKFDFEGIFSKLTKISTRQLKQKERFKKN